MVNLLVSCKREKINKGGCQEGVSRSQPLPREALGKVRSTQAL